MFVIDVMAKANDDQSVKPDEARVKKFSFADPDTVEIGPGFSAANHLRFGKMGQERKASIPRLPILRKVKPVIDADRLTTLGNVVVPPVATIKAAPSRPDTTGQVRFRNTSSHTGQIQENAPDALLENQVICAELQYLDPAGWRGNKRDQGSFIIPDRRLLSERNEWKQSKIVALAQGYLALGFGYEGRMVSKLISDIEQKDAFIWVAGLVENQPFGTVPNIERLPDCEALLLWQLLNGTKNGPLDIKAIMKHFDELPFALKQHLADRISAKLVDYDQLDAAEFVLRSAQGLEGGRLGELPLAQARIASKRGHLDLSLIHI